MINILQSDIVNNKVKWNYREFLLLIIMCAVQIKNGQVLALFCAAILAIDGIIFAIKTPMRIKSAFFIWTLAVFMMILLTTLFSAETWIEMVWLFTGIFVTFGAMLNRKEINHRTEIILIPTFILCAANILYYYNIVNFDFIFIPAYARTRMQGGFDGPNELGAFLTIAIVYIWMSHIHVKKVKLIYLSTAIIVFATILTWSRGSLLTLAALVCFILYHRIKYSNRKYRIFVFLLVIIIVAVAVTVIYNYFLPKLAYIRRSAGTRDGITDVVILAFKSHPIFGQGLNSFSKYGRNTTPHSSYFFTLVSGGIVGLSALIYFYFNFAYEAFIRKMKPEFWALSAYFILEQSFNNIVRGRVLFLFLILIFFIYAPSHQTERRS